MNRVLHVLLAILISGFAAAQQKPTKPPPAAPTVLISADSYALPLAERDKFRDLQHEYDAIEIENQKMLVQIEQNKAKQNKIVDQEMDIASKFGRDNNLDLSQFELDPAPIVLRKKKGSK